MYISHPFHYLLNYHILHFYQPFHYHIIAIYTLLHPLNNYHNLQLTLLSHFNKLLYILIHLQDNLNMSQYPVLLNLHRMLYIFIHLVDNSDNFLMHLSSHFNTIHKLMHQQDSFYMSLELPIFHFHSILKHLVDNLNTFLMVLFYHYRNLKISNNSDYNTEDNHLLNFMEPKDIHPYYQVFHLDLHPYLTSILHHHLPHP